MDPPPAFAVQRCLDIAGGVTMPLPGLTMPDDRGAPQALGARGASGGAQVAPQRLADDLGCRRAVGARSGDELVAQRGVQRDRVDGDLLRVQPRQLASPATLDQPSRVCLEC
jgi:hypothetical protein